MSTGLKTEYISVAFETGEVYIFNIKNDNLVQVAAKFDNFNNLPCLTMATLETGSKNVLALGHLNGEVRIYNLSAEANFNMICSFGEHLTMINQIVSYKDYLITCGDDCFVNVWKINTSDDNENKVSIVYNYEFSH